MGDATDDALTILVLHRLGDPRRWRSSMAEHELCLPRFAPEHNYVVHNAALPYPTFARDIDFDGIVLCQTFLSRRRDPAAFAKTLEEYDFVRTSRAFKIALPQDDYDCSAILDRWLQDWKVDVTYPVCTEHWDVLYPTYRRVGELRQGYTGYISPVMRSRWAAPRAARFRRIDVSYRAAKLPPSFGSLGYLKGVIGERFLSAASGSGLVLDVSTDPKDTIVGARWHDFLEDSRCVLGVNSGSSLLDPDGSINHRVYDFVVRHPTATYAEVEAACFAGEDGRYVFTALSPRNIECALIESAQLLTPGAYGGVLRAGEHYIAIEPDMSNADDVLRQVADIEAASAIARASKEALLKHSELYYEHHVAELTQLLSKGMLPRESGAQRRIRALVDRYRAQIIGVERTHWHWYRTVEAAREALVRLGFRRVKRMLIRATGR